MAVDAGGGWVPLTFTRIGVYPDGDSTTITSDFSHTTGLHVPVDAGVAAAFLR